MTWYHGMLHAVINGQLYMISATPQPRDRSFVINSLSNVSSSGTAATATMDDVCTVVTDGRIICTDIASGDIWQLGASTFPGATAMTSFNSLYYLLDHNGYLWSVDPFNNGKAQQIGNNQFDDGNLLTSGPFGLYSIQYNMLCGIDVTNTTDPGYGACTMVGDTQFNGAVALTSILDTIYIAVGNVINSVILQSTKAQPIVAQEHAQWSTITSMTNINGYLFILDNNGTLWEVARTKYASIRQVGHAGSWGKKGIIALTAFSDRSLWYDIGAVFKYEFQSLSNTNGVTANDTDSVARQTQYNIDANLTLISFASNPESVYLNLTITSMTAIVDGNMVPANITADQFEIENSVIVVQARNGTVLHIYAHVNESAQSINFKRAMASMLNTYTGVRTVDVSNNNGVGMPTRHDKHPDGHAQYAESKQAISETDVTGSYQAKYSVQRMSHRQYRWSRSKSQFTHYHPLARPRVTRTALDATTTPTDDSTNDDDVTSDEHEVEIQRMDHCTTDIIDGFISARECQVNTSILADSQPLPSSVAPQFNSTNGTVGGHSLVSFRLLATDEIDCSIRGQCLSTIILTSPLTTPSAFVAGGPSTSSYAQNRVEFEPVSSSTTGGGYRSRTSRNAEHPMYSSHSPLIRQILAHDGGCYDRMSCTRLLPELMTSLRSTQHVHDFTSVQRDFNFITNGGLSRSRLTRSKFDTGSTYRTLLSALIAHGSDFAQQSLIHQFQNGAPQHNARDHILLSFAHLKNPSQEWSKPLQRAYMNGSDTAALSLGLLVDQTGHQQSRQFLLQHHTSALAQLHSTDDTKRSDPEDDDEEDSEPLLNNELISKGKLLTHALANIRSHNNWFWLRSSLSSSSSQIRETAQKLLQRFRSSMKPFSSSTFPTSSLVAPTNDLTSVMMEGDDWQPFETGMEHMVSSQQQLSSSSSPADWFPFDVKQKYDKSIGNDKAGITLKAQYLIYADMDRYLTMDALTDNFINFGVHIFELEFGIIEASASFDIRSYDNAIDLTLGRGTYFEKTVFHLDLPCKFATLYCFWLFIHFFHCVDVSLALLKIGVACVLQCAGPKGDFGSGQREVYTFTDIVMVGPLPIELSVGLWAGYDLDYQLQLCLLYRPPSFLASLGAGASVFARATAGVNLLVVRGGVSIDIAIFEGSLGPQLTLNLKEVCASAHLIVSALSGHIDAFYETRGCGWLWVHWCGPHSLTLLSWNGPAASFVYPFCYPILGPPSSSSLSSPVAIVPNLRERWLSLLAPTENTFTNKFSTYRNRSLQQQQIIAPSPMMTFESWEQYYTDCNGQQAIAYYMLFNMDWKIPFVSAYLQLAQTVSTKSVPRQSYFTRDDEAGNDQAANSDYLLTGMLYIASLLH
jgi:hypothetical protein